MPKKRKDGRQERKVTINGKRISVYGHSADEIDEKVAKLKKDAEMGIKADKTMTVDDMYKAWKKNHTISESTAAEYDKKYKAISQYIGKLRLTEVSTQTCVNLIEKLEKETVTKGDKTKRRFISSGINSRIIMLKGIMQLAVDRRLISYNPVSGIAKKKRTEPKIRDAEHRALTDQELKLFLSESTKSDYYNIMCFLAYTGMRSGEAAALTWGDISKKRAYVCKTTTRVNGQTVISPKPKTESSERYVPLTEDAQKILTDQKKRLMMLYGGEALKADAPVFPKSRGGLIDSTVLNSCIIQIVRRINKKEHKLDRFSPHAFRHTYATIAVRNGMQPGTLQKILGHADISMTMNLYYHCSEEEKDEAASKLKFGF